MIEVARESFRLQDTLLILKTGALLTKIEPEKQEPALEAFQKICTPITVI